jgi:ring-1,2-phenylacetyl-CoA epoxidase subunit PaaD
MNAGPMRTEVEQQVWDELSKVQDPEIPVLSLVDLKIIRQVKAEGKRARVVLTPTFAGCPALEAMKTDIKQRPASAGFSEVTVDVDFSGSWSTDMLEDSAREKLRSFGTAPPVPMGKNGEASRDLAQALAEPVQCPHCGSTKTRLESFFGSSLCRQIFYCDACRQSFDPFKPI